MLEKADLQQAELEDRLATTTRKVEKQLHTMGGFDVQDYIPRNLQGTSAGREVQVTSSGRYEILDEALMTVLTSPSQQGLPYSGCPSHWRLTCRTNTIVHYSRLTPVDLNGQSELPADCRTQESRSPRRLPCPTQKYGIHMAGGTRVT